MKKWLWVAIITVLVLPGCVVSKSKYNAAVSDMESAKAELEKSRMHREALEQQIKNLKDVNEKMSRDLEVMSSEVQRIKEGRANEQALLEAREKELEQEKTVLTAKLRSLAKKFKQLRNQNQALKETVLRYQKELKESRNKTVAGGGTTTAQPGRSSNKASIPPAPGSRSPVVPSKIIPASPPSGSGAPLVNINTASVSDLVLFLGLTKEMAQAVVDHRPYRLRGELVAKRVLPKPTFDTIKDKITAAP